MFLCTVKSVKIKCWWHQTFFDPKYLPGLSYKSKACLEFLFMGLWVCCLLAVVFRFFPNNAEMHAVNRLLYLHLLLLIVMPQSLCWDEVPAAYTIMRRNPIPRSHTLRVKLCCHRFLLISLHFKQSKEDSSWCSVHKTRCGVFIHLATIFSHWELFVKRQIQYFKINA